PPPALPDPPSLPTRRSSDLLGRAGRGERVDHVFGDRRDHRIDLATAKRLADRLGLAREAADLEQRCVALHRAVEGDHRGGLAPRDRKSTRLNSSHDQISYAV